MFGCFIHPKQRKHSIYNKQEEEEEEEDVQVLLTKICLQICFFLINFISLNSNKSKTGKRFGWVGAWVDE
jgi:hypothetical protein